MKKPLKILIALTSYLGKDRQICQGIYKYLNMMMTCETLIINCDRQSLEETLESWHPEALIGKLGRVDLMEAVDGMEIPMVSIYGGEPLAPSLPQVGTCDYRTGKIAADFLLGKGFERFGYFCLPGVGYQIGRKHGFTETVQSQDGTHISTLCGQDLPERNRDLTRKETGEYLKMLTDWLVALDKPVAIFASDVIRARWVWHQCCQAGIRVPEEVAVLGVFNDFMVTQQSVPPLAVVDTPGMQEGYCAAEMLVQLLEGNAPSPRHVYLSPYGIIDRGSTDTLVVNDEATARAIEFIKDYACQGIRVTDVAERVGVSRRVLEKRFRTHINRSPAREIRRIQMRRVMELLRETGMTTEAIAERAGLTNKNRLAMEFRKHTGTTPSEYRRTHQTL